MLLYYFWVMELVKKEMALDFGKVVLLENGILSFVRARLCERVRVRLMVWVFAARVLYVDSRLAVSSCTSSRARVCA